MKYTVSPGRVRSADGDVHYINAEQLIRLYGVGREGCRARYSYAYPVLFPRNDGLYVVAGRPNLRHPAVWIQKDGTRIAVPDMATSHLENTLAFLEREWPDAVGWRRQYDTMVCELSDRYASFHTDDVRSLAAICLADCSRLPVLYDALADAGFERPELREYRASVGFLRALT